MSTEEAEALDRLLFHLENQIGFWFALVVGDDPRPRARLREEAKAWCKEHRRAFILHEPDPHGLVRLAVELAKGDRPGVHWIRCDGPRGLIDQWDAGASQLLSAMNERRDAYRKRLDGGVVIEGRESLKRHLRELAPDLFSIRAFIAEPGASSEAALSSTLDWRLPQLSMLAMLSVRVDPDHELERAARLSNAEGLGARRAWIDALVNGVLGLLLAKRIREVEHVNRELITAAERLRNEHPSERAFFMALGIGLANQALVASARGGFEEARRYFDESLELIESEYLAIAKSEPVQNSTKPEDVWLLLGAIHQLRGHILAQIGDLPSAVDSFRQRLGFVMAVANANPSNEEMQLNMAVAQREFADALKEQLDFSTAEELLRSAIDAANRYASEQPSDDRWQLELLEGHRALGNVLRERGDFSGALEVLRTALLIAEGLAARNAKDVRWQVEMCEINALLGALFFLQSNAPAALEFIKTASYILSTELDRNPDNESWKDLAVAGAHQLELHVLVGASLLESGYLPAGTFKVAAKLGERLMSAAPKDPAVRADLLAAYDLLATTLELQGRLKAARRVRRRRRALRRSRSTRP